MIVGDDGTVWICDWNWPVLGAPWLDLVTVVIAAHGDGLDTDAVLADHVLTRDVDPRSIDAWLAALWCYFTTRMEDEVPHGSPHLRDHQAWYADVCEDWLTPAYGTDAGGTVTDKRLAGVRTPYAEMPADAPSLGGRAARRPGRGDRRPHRRHEPGGGGHGRRTADGRRAFVKAVSADINPDTPTHFRHEIAVLSDARPGAVPGRPARRPTTTSTGSR